MSLWYAVCDALPLEMLHWDFMKNALLALLLMAPLFGVLSTMIVTGHMSFFSALRLYGHCSWVPLRHCRAHLGRGSIQRLLRPTVLLSPPGQQSGGGYADWRLLQRRCGSGHSGCHHGRRQLHKIQ